MQEPSAQLKGLSAWMFLGGFPVCFILRAESTPLRCLQLLAVCSTDLKLLLCSACWWLLLNSIYFFHQLLNITLISSSKEAIHFSNLFLSSLKHIQHQSERLQVLFGIPGEQCKAQNKCNAELQEKSSEILLTVPTLSQQNTKGIKILICLLLVYLSAIPFST